MNPTDTFTVYILYSPEHKRIYIGLTSNLLQRFRSHNQLSNKGWTTKYRPWQVIYTAMFDSRELAAKREKELKQANWRNRIWQQVHDDYPQKGFINL